jgi:DNA-binding MarR family transcriptional regulator
MDERAQPAAESDDWLLHLSRTLSATVRSARHPRLYRRIGEEANVDLSEHLYLLFNRIAEYQPVRMATLSTVMDLDRSTVSRQVAELSDAGYVQRVPDPDDRRSMILILTRTGEKLLDRVWQVWSRILQQLTAEWSAEERNTFTALFDSLSQALKELSGDDDPIPSPGLRNTWP